MATVGPVMEWAQTLEHHRSWVRGWIADDHEVAQFDQDWQTKLSVVASVAPHLKPDDTPAWQALGVVFGDALSMVTGLPWGEVTDEYGTDPCIVVDAERFLLFPMTMLSKRAEQGDPPDREAIVSLFKKAAEEVLRGGPQSAEAD